MLDFHAETIQNLPVVKGRRQRTLPAHKELKDVLSRFCDEFAEVWWPTHRTLCEVAEKERISPGQERARRIWFNLGTIFNLSPEKERVRFERLQADARRAAATFCSLSSCQYHSERPLSRLRICAGCGQVGYCSRECQKACVLVLFKIFSRLTTVEGIGRSINNGANVASKITEALFDLALGTCVRQHVTVEAQCLIQFYSFAFVTLFYKQDRSHTNHPLNSKGNGLFTSSTLR